MANLSDQVAEFIQRLPEIRKQVGSAWAVLAEHDIKGPFSTYGEAVDFAVANYTSGRFVIRHTDVSNETIPFMVVEA